MKKKIGKRAMQTIEVKTNKNGFSLWITEKVDGKSVTHWLLDGSLVKQTCKIQLATCDLYRYDTVFNEIENSVELIDKGKITKSK